MALQQFDPQKGWNQQGVLHKTNGWSTDDTRHTTHLTRTDIGFRKYGDWKTQPAVYDEHTLTIDGHPVMEDWEDGYMRTLADIACSQGGVVLEVGFGMGISAEYVQTHQIAEHIIIEANADVFQKLAQFATKSCTPVRPYFGFWQEVLPLIPDNSITGILFDTYPLAEEEIHKNHFFFFEEAFRVLKPGGILTYYSDEARTYSPDHFATLKRAGFVHIDGEICEVDPPIDCAYWKEKTILAPKVYKPLGVKDIGNSYGLHLTIDGYGGDQNKLADVGLLYQFLRELPLDIGMTPVGFPHIIEFNEPHNAGISGFAFIVESHISLHSYALKGFVSMDVYSCKSFHWETVVDKLKKLYALQEVHPQTVVRGTCFPAENIYPPT